MKKLISILLILMICAALCACGDVSQAKIIDTDSKIYTQEELSDAIHTAIDYFRQNYDHCKLLNIRYAGDGNMREEFGLVVVFDFSTDNSDAVYKLGSFSPGETYSDMSFGMVRNGYGKWEVKNVGWYGA